MKKIVLAVILLNACLLASDDTVAKIRAYSWNKFINNLVEEKLELRYRAKDDEIYLYIPDQLTPTEITISDEYRKVLIDLIKKHERLETRAISWEEQYDEELGALPTADSRFMKGSFWYDSRVNTTANFFSQSPEMHQFILFFSEMPASENKSISCKGRTFYFGQKEIKELKNIFLERNFIKYRPKK